MHILKSYNPTHISTYTNKQINAHVETHIHLHNSDTDNWLLITMM